MAKMGLSVRDDPPKVVDLTVREWGPEQAGLAVSVADIPREDPDSLPRISVLIRNVGQERTRFEVPGWQFFYDVDVRLPDGSRMGLSPFGREMLKPERRVESIAADLGPGEFVETEIPIGSFFNLRARGRYVVSASCEPMPGVTLQSNEISIA